MTGVQTCALPIYRGESKNYGDRPERSERPSYGARGDRGDRPERSDRPARGGDRDAPRVSFGYGGKSAVYGSGAADAWEKPTASRGRRSYD